MKKNKELKRIKPRSHQMLFDNDLPFWPKVEKRKDQYRRKLKHRKSTQGDDDEQY